MILFVFNFIFLFSVISFMFMRKYVLLCLLILEFIVISLLLMMIFLMIMFLSSLYFYLLLITFFVCDSVLGLSLLVYMIRCHGNNNLNSMFLW
uniref:NADH dehydrogenase subunit 4L n=1 Tax=Krisna furcata TaxID=1962556 RepID=UPI002551D30F|nr:NADH dehydrogenase subunit 4L [Krisna furcata]WGG89429.1 NADH dehydrogenase subunit 4L [Krisna furcata]